MEEWKDIEGYEGLYQVSNEGRIKSLERVVIRNDGISRDIKEKIMRLFLNNKHLYVSLSKNGVDKDLQVHRIVAETFILNPHNYDVVHHIDHNPQNNRVGNLMWLNDKDHKKLHQIDRVSAVKENCGKTVFQYTLDGELVAVWESGAEAAKQTGFNQSHIVDCCLGKRKTHKGFKWSYKEL